MLCSHYRPDGGRPIAASKAIDVERKCAWRSVPNGVTLHTKWRTWANWRQVVHMFDGIVDIPAGLCASWLIYRRGPRVVVLRAPPWGTYPEMVANHISFHCYDSVTLTLRRKFSTSLTWINSLRTVYWVMVKEKSFGPGGNNALRWMLIGNISEKAEKAKVGKIDRGRQL